MDKKTALIVLIENSYILGKEAKAKMLVKVKEMTDDEVNEWGKLLSEEQSFVAESKESILARINSL